MKQSFLKTTLHVDHYRYFLRFSWIPWHFNVFLRLRGSEHCAQPQSSSCLAPLAQSVSVSNLSYFLTREGDVLYHLRRMKENCISHPFQDGIERSNAFLHISFTAADIPRILLVVLQYDDGGERWLVLLFRKSLARSSELLEDWVRHCKILFAVFGLHIVFLWGAENGLTLIRL